MQLYSYFRSSAAYRLRIALELKGLDYDYVAVNLLESEQKQDDYRSLNPMGLVPALQLGSGEVLTQSVAILEWIEEMQPSPTLLPQTPLGRAKARALVSIISCDIHPICNLSITDYLKHELSADEAVIQEWYRTWMHRGFNGFEKSIVQTSGRFCLGDAPSLADVCLVPQVFNALRFRIDLSHFPNIQRIYDYCIQLAPFQSAAPENQPDYC